MNPQGEMMPNPTKRELEEQVAELQAELAAAREAGRAAQEATQAALDAAARMEAKASRRPSLEDAVPSQEPHVWVEMTRRNPDAGRFRRRYSIGEHIFEADGPMERRCCYVPKSMAAHLVKQHDERQRGTTEGAVLFIDRGETRPY